MKATRSLRPRLSAVVLLVVLSALLAPVAAAASTVRGRLVRSRPSGDYPAQGVGVTLNARAGRSARIVTNSEGMYYFYGIQPGAYQLEIWVNPKGAPIIQELTVGTAAYTDVPPIRVP